MIGMLMLVWRKIPSEREVAPAQNLLTAHREAYLPTYFAIYNLVRELHQLGTFLKPYSNMATWLFGLWELMELELITVGGWERMGDCYDYQYVVNKSL